LEQINVEFSPSSEQTGIIYICQINNVIYINNLLFATGNNAMEFASSQLPMEDNSNENGTIEMQNLAQDHPEEQTPIVFEDGAK
jgi:hypothetical protein